MKRKKRDLGKGVNKIILFLVIIVVVYIIFVSALYYFSEKSEEEGLGSLMINPFKIFYDIGSLDDFTREIDLIQNPDFEEAFVGERSEDGWFFTDKGDKSEWSIDCTESYSGSCSAKLSVFENLGSREISEVLNSKRYALSPNKIYYLYFWTKENRKSGNKGAQFTLVLEDENMNLIDTKSVVRRFNNKGWVKHQIRFKTDNKIKKFRVYSRAVGTEGLEYWVDNLKLKIVDEEAEIPRIKGVYTAESLFNEEKVDELRDKEINTFLVKGRYDNNEDYSEYNDNLPGRIRINARLAKEKNINYFQVLNFVHRVDDSIITDNYVVYSDGRVGKHVTPFDEVYWNHLTSLVVNLARLPILYPDNYQIKGVFFDFELYKNEDYGEPRKFDETWGFEDTTFNDYLTDRNIEELNSPPKNQEQKAERYSWLETNKLLEDYYSYLHDIIRGFAEEMRNRVREVNPDFLISAYPSPNVEYLNSVFNGWSSENDPAVIWGTETYYGSELKNILEQNRIPQGYYYLYDLYGEEIYAYYIGGLVVTKGHYSINNFAYNLYKIGTKSDGYWMFPSYSFTESFKDISEINHLKCYDSINNILYKCEEYEYPKIVKDYYNEMVVANSEINKFVGDNSYETFLIKEQEPLRECSNGQSLQCGSNIGECDFGIRNCVNEEWDICEGDIEPVEEIMDRLDNDCDGEVDESGGSSYDIMEIIKDNKGVWTWFNDPRGLCYNGKTYLGWITSEGKIVVYQYNHLTGEENSFILNSNFEIDDHNNPAFTILEDGKIMAIYSRHYLTRGSYYRITENPEDITSWTSEKYVSSNYVTYANPFYLSDERVVYDFYRGGNGERKYATYNPSTDSWNSPKNLFVNGNNRPYIKYWSNDKDEIHFTVTNGHPNEIINNIYHFYYKDGNFYKTDGTLIGSESNLPLRPSDVTKAYDGSSTNSWIWDIVVKDDIPYIVYTTYENMNDITYRYAKWDPSISQWKNYFITNSNSAGLYSSERHYAGGIVIDNKNPNMIYVSIKVNGIFEIQKFITNDGGESWNKEDITFGSYKDNLRPYVIKNYNDNFDLVWFKGDYNTYINWDTDIYGRKRSGGSNIPAITSVETIPNVNPSEGLSVPVDFEFIVQDDDGVSDLDDSSAKARFIKQDGGIKTGDCSRIQEIDESSVKYSCTINMHYYDKPGEWKIYVEVFDFSGNKASDESKNFYYNEAIGFSIDSNSLNWETVGLGGENIILNEPLIVHNTGNADIDLLKIRSYDLKGVDDNSYSFDVESFSVNVFQECGGIVLVDESVVDIAGSNIPVIDEFGGGLEEIYFCLEEVPLGLKSQEYINEEGKKWVVGI